MEVSYYIGGITQTKPNKSFDAVKLLEIIRSTKYHGIVSKLRSAKDANVRKGIKSDLDYVTWSGVFTKRQNDRLVMHSGLLCIDFDDLEDVAATKEQLIKDKYSFAVFLSPSGNGLKVLVLIEAAHHLESFLELEQYYLLHYGLVVDKSGKDVARACFMSYDPNLYVNEAATAWFVVKKTTAASAPIADQLPAIVPVKKANPKDLERVAFCVAQLEQNRIDVTHDYDDWLRICFAMSTLGEEGRPFFHRISAFNEKYDAKLCDEKFDECVKNRSKVRTPNPFYTILGDYGLESKKPREVKADTKGADLLPEGADETEFEQFGFWEYNNIYWSISARGGKYAVSNFTMEILFHVQTGGEEAYRMIKIKNVHGYSAVINMNTDDFVSLSAFRKLIARRGNFLWKGNDDDLVRLQDKLQREERATDLIDILGYHPKGNFYAFANGIIDLDSSDEHQFNPVDEYGIVKHKDKNYFIPAFAKMYADKDDLYYNYKKFIFIKRDYPLQKWFELFDKVYGQNGRIGFIYYVASIFSSSIYKLLGRRFPILSLYGQRGSGKGTFAESILALFGEPQEQIMLGGNTTQVGFMRTFAQFRDSLVWLDEYKNNLHKKVIEAIKNIYDRIGYKRGKKDHSFEVDYVPVQSACILSGQEMPTIEPALYTRVIMLTFEETKHNEESRAKFRELMEQQKNGLSHLTVYLLQHGPYIIEHFKEVWEAEVKEISNQLKDAQIEERMINNYACLSAVCKLLLDKEKLGFKHHGFRTILVLNLSTQQAVLVGSDDTTKFWHVVESLFAQGLIREDVDFMLADGNLFLRLQNVSGLYEKEMRMRNDPNSLSKATLEHYLSIDKAKFKGKVKKQFKNGSYTWCYVFDYRVLDINLIKFSENETQETIAAKYKEMNVDFEPEGKVSDTDQAKGAEEKKEGVPF